MPRALLFTLGGLILLTVILFWAFPEVQFTSEDRLQYVSLILIATYLIFALFQGRMNLSEVARYTLIWVGVGLVLMGGYAYRHELMDFKSRLTSVIYPSTGKVTAPGEVYFEASNDGHFYVTAMVNGVKIRFMVDTGASRVVLNQRDAIRLGFNEKDLTFNSRSSTANGSVWGANVTLETILVEDHPIHDVPASVSKDELDVSLLGMSYLNKLKGYKVERGGLTLQY